MRQMMKNFLLIITGDITRRILGFIAVAYLARKIGADGFGMVNIGFAILSYALMVSSAGLNSLGAREVAKGSPQAIVGQILALRLLLSMIAILVTCFVILFVTDHQLAIVIVMFNFALIPQAFFLDWYFQGKEKAGSIVTARIIGALIYALSIFLLIESQADIRWVGLCVVLGDVATAGSFMFRFIRTDGIPIFRFDISSWRILLRQSIPVATGSIIGTLCMNFPILAIGYWLSNADVGIYSAASKLVFFLLMFDRVIGTLLLPASARLHERKPEDFTARLQMTLKWMFIITLSCSLGAVLVAKNIIVLIYGEQYLGSSLILQVGIWYFFFTIFHTIYSTGLIAIGKENLYSRIMSISALLYFITVIAGIKFFGVVGAAGAAVVSEAITLVMMQQAFGKFITVPMPSSLVKILISAIGMMVIVVILSNQPVIVTILAGGIVYVALLFITRAVTLGEILTLVKQAA